MKTQIKHDGARPRMKQGSTTDRPVALDCFSGCGGMTEGLKQAGFRVLGAVENDSRAVEAYRLNHPEVHVWSTDIRVLSAQSVLDTFGLRRGELDLLGGCPPCQGFSTLRTKNGSRRVRDSQNDLIFEFQRLVLELLPRLVMLENVPGLLKDRRLREFVAALEDAGYSIVKAVLNVADYGVPQRRKRTVLIAWQDGVPTLAGKVSQVVTVRGAIGDLPPAGSSGDSLHDIPERRSPTVQQRIKGVPTNGGSRAALPKRLALKCHTRSDGFKDVYGRMAWDQVAPTITTGCFNPSKGRFLHPDANRSITIREAALLQSFPPGYRFPLALGKVKLAQMIGNALPPKFIRVLAEQMTGLAR